MGRPAAKQQPPHHRYLAKVAVGMAQVLSVKNRLPIQAPIYSWPRLTRTAVCPIGTSPLSLATSGAIRPIQTPNITYGGGPSQSAMLVAALWPVRYAPCNELWAVVETASPAK